VIDRPKDDCISGVLDVRVAALGEVVLISEFGGQGIVVGAVVAPR
jgi:hypothetical protein